MIRSLYRLTLVLAVLTAVPIDALALKFRIIENDGFGHRVLLVHDCDAIKDNPSCSAEETMFSAGDDGRFVNAWRGQIDEVWLLSGGGNLDAGIKIAAQLRARGATVRVPGAARLLRAGLHMDPDLGSNCVSACTVTFMGGQFRLIDPDATYEVHSASSVLWGNPKDPSTTKTIEAFRGLIKEDGLRAAANALTKWHRETARDLFLIFQESLWLPIQDGRTQSERRQRDQVLSDFVSAGVGRSYSYDAAQLAQDQQVYDLEGTAALQDILMRIERDSMDQVIAEIRARLPRLGRRADAALAILAAMYDTSSIKETNVVPRETLLKMGYVTEFVK